MNQLDGIFETAFMDFEKFMFDAGLVVASHDNDNIERAIQERQGHHMCRPYYLDTWHTGLKSVAVLPTANTAIHPNTLPNPYQRPIKWNNQEEHQRFDHC
jgi:hypothetical protein